MNARRSLIVAALGALLCFGGAIEASAQAAAGAPQTTSRKLVATNWNVGCQPAQQGKKMLCEASKRILLEQGRSLLLAIYVTPTGKGKGAEAFILRYQLPHGLDLAAGVKAQIDTGDALSPAIVTSSQAGVFARSVMTAKTLASLRKGKTMTVAFSGLNGSKLSIPVSLQGFSAVYDKLN